MVKKLVLCVLERQIYVHMDILPSGVLRVYIPIYLYLHTYDSRLDEFRINLSKFFYFFLCIHTFGSRLDEWELEPFWSAGGWLLGRDCVWEEEPIYIYIYINTHTHTHTHTHTYIHTYIRYTYIYVWYKYTHRVPAVPKCVPWQVPWLPLAPRDCSPSSGFVV
jgi:hypothetical protein